ncbi:MAG TPA: DUF5681 domain-containing protein [Methylomirabilota bacterium]|nr:DUF5681 domain-containing protein [Methylomirabilota bacterium]
MTKKGEIKGKGNNPNSRAALKSYKKGESGNPKGRPIGSLSLKERLAKFSSLEISVKMPNGSIQSQTIMDSIILSLLSQAQKGNIMAIKEVLDRNFGKESERTDILVLKEAKTFSAQYDCIKEELSEGNLAPNEAMTLANFVLTGANIHEKTELANNVEYLMSKDGKR